MKRWFPILATLAAFALSTHLAAAEPQNDPLGAPPAYDPLAALSGFSPSRPLIHAELIPERRDIRPGKPFTVALKLTHQPDTYSYWLNPGGPGMPTRAVWVLPTGFTVGGARWPAPSQSASSGFVVYIYKGEKLVLFTITPPSNLSPGETAELSLHLEGQVCTDSSCQPFKTDLPLDLPVVAADAPEDTSVNIDIERARATLPAIPKGWTFSAKQSGKRLILEMAPGAGANPEPGRVYFFDRQFPDPFVDSTQPQWFEKTETGWRLVMAAHPGRNPLMAGRLSGVLCAAEGWLEDDSSVVDFELIVPITESSDAAFLDAGPKVKHSVGMLLLFAFLGGLVLNIMPCVFPVLSLKVMSLVRHAHQERSSTLLHGLSYTAGVLTCFWALAILVITLARAWGAQLQFPWFVVVLCLVFLVMALNMAGLFEIGIFVAGGVDESARKSKGLKRQFFTGILATLTSTPCSAPFLGTALAYALSLPWTLCLGLFTVLALGFALPYLVLAAFPSLLKRLPKPGPWMKTFHNAMSFFLFGTVAYLMYVLAGQLDEHDYLMLLMGLLVVAFGCWVYGQSQTFARPGRKYRLGVAGAIIILIAGVFMAWPDENRRLEWVQWKPGLVEDMRATGRPVYIDFTARWCITCQVNKRVYEHPEIRDAFKSRGVILVKADWTRYDEGITQTLRDEFGKAAVPVNVLYQPGRDDATVLPELLTVANVKAALDS